MKRSPALSLRARALQALAQREYSRTELRAKLLRVRAGHSHPRPREAGTEEDEPPGEPEATSESAVDDLLDELQAKGLLDDSRFLESRIHLRAPRFGNLRIRQELKRHGVALDEASAAELRRTELQRAQAVWARRFGTVATSAAERAKQIRFLGARGFSAETVSQVLRGASDALGESLAPETDTTPEE